MRSVLPLVALKADEPGRQDARVDAQEGQLADERVGHDLERQRRERRVVGGRTRDRRRVGLADVEPFHGRDVERRRQVVDDRVEHRLDALVLERRAADDDDERRLLVAHRVDHALAQRRLDRLLRDLLAAEVLLEDLVVDLADLLDQLLAVDLGLGLELGRDLLDDVVGAHRLVLVRDGLHPYQVDDALELVLAADRQLDRHRVGLQLGLDLAERRLEVGADAVHLVDEADARHAVLVRLAPHRLRLRLHTRHGVEHGAGAVQHAQRALDFSGEVDVAGRVDDVDLDVAPRTGRRGRRDRDPALLLLLHPVHHRGAFVHLTDLVGDARVEQDALGRRRLAGIDVGHDADVATTIQGYLPWHN